MKKYKLQIIMLSGQAIQNVTPIVDDNIKPEKIIMCVTDKMKKHAETLAQYFKQRQIESEKYFIGNAYDYDTLQEKFLELAARLEEQKNNVAVNLTGGTKLMTICAQMVFAQNDFTCFYVIPEQDTIRILKDSEPGKYEIQDRLKIEDFFRIHGYKVKSFKHPMNITRESREVFGFIRINFNKYQKAFSSLNYFASEATQKKCLNTRAKTQDIQSLLGMLSQYGKISYFDLEKIEFPNEDARDFCRGFWLEEYTYLALAQLDKDIDLQDYAGSIKVESENGTSNEIDAAFIFNNNLYIIECKTTKTDDNKPEMLYKIDTVKEYAGMFTKPIIVSLNQLQEVDQIRAADLNIKLITGDKIVRLKDELRNIIENQQRICHP